MGSWVVADSPGSTTPGYRLASLRDAELGGLLRIPRDSCPEGTRLGEANVHNRRCLSRRVRYLRTEAAPPISPARRAVLHNLNFLASSAVKIILASS